MMYRMLTANMFLIGVFVFSVQFYGGADGIKCLACTGVIQPRYCTNIRHCPQHGVCHTATSNKTVVGSDLHYSTNGMLVTCGECCSDDLCNQQGCGEIGYPKERGLLCYNCKQVLDPGSCDKISICRTDEDCLSSLSETFGRKKRQSLPTPCSTCCQSDMCNDYCGQVSMDRPSGHLSNQKTTTVSTVSPTVPYSDSTGNEFVFMFTSKYFKANSRTLFENVMIVTRPGDNVDLDVDLPSGLGNNTLSGQGLIEFNITNTTVMSRNNIETKAVYLRTSEPVTVFAMNYERYVSDAFLVLPVTACSKEYIVSTNQSLYGENTFVGIVSLYQSNSINITLTTYGEITFKSTTYRNGDTLSITLQKHETFELANHYDLTGTRITSSHPVCVTAGSNCARITTSNPDCSRVEEMMIPVKYFTNSFVVPSIYQRPGSIVRIVSSVDVNVVTWNSSGIIGKVTLGRGLYKDLEINNVMTYIESSDLITVAQYIKEHEVDDGFMMLLPGLSQYKYDYDFVVYGNGFISYVTVIIPSNHTNGLILDGNSLSVIPGSQNTLDVHTVQYEVFAVAVSHGSHNMRHSGQERFGLFVYGSLKNDLENNGYGYPAGFRFI